MQNFILSYFGCKWYVCGWCFGLAWFPIGFDPVTSWLMRSMLMSFVIKLGLIYYVEYLVRYDLDIWISCLCYEVYSVVIMNEALMPIYLRCLDSLAWYLILFFITWKYLIIVLFYNISFKVLVIYIYVTVFFLQIRIIL